jgi:serine/threonine protein kinase
MATVPFSPPHLLTARRTAGFVDVPESGNSSPLGWDGHALAEDCNWAPQMQQPEKLKAGPTYLKRSQTMAGNIVVFEDDGKPPQAFWLQRKISKSSSGVIRLAYKLRPNTKPEFKESTEAWELATEESGHQPMVTIHMMHSSVLDSKSEDKDVHNPLDELSALQMIAKHKDSGDAHVVGTDIVATCSQHVYAVLPYHRDGTLLQYCLAEGSLNESVARFFFSQILKVRCWKVFC